MNIYITSFIVSLVFVLIMIVESKYTKKEYTVKEFLKAFIISFLSSISGIYISVQFDSLIQKTSSPAVFTGDPDF